MTMNIAAAHAALADYAELVGDVDFTPTDAGLDETTTDALVSEGRLCLGDDGIVDEVADIDHRAARRTHNDTDPVRVLTDTNPKRGKSAERFAHYYTSSTVGEYVARCVADGWPRAKARADVRWDTAHGHITTTTDAPEHTEQPIAAE